MQIEINEQQIVALDLATRFLDDVYLENHLLTKLAIQTIKDQIDAAFLTKVRLSKTAEEISAVFENYLDFFDTYQEFI